MADLVEEFLRPGELVVDLFSGTLTTTKACSEHPHNHRFTGCEVYAECFAEGAEALLGKKA